VIHELDEFVEAESSDACPCGGRSGRVRAVLEVLERFVGQARTQGTDDVPEHLPRDVPAVPHLATTTTLSEYRAASGSEELGRQTKSRWRKENDRQTADRDNRNQ